jgi:hypothetical protein
MFFMRPRMGQSGTAGCSKGGEMNTLLFIFALEAGVLPNYEFVIYQPDLDYVEADYSFYTSLEITAELYGFYLGGAMKCYMWRNTGRLNFHPYQMTYRFDAGWRNDWLTLGFRHYCIHPVIPLAGVMLPEQNWEEAFEELFIRVDLKARM